MGESQNGCLGSLTMLFSVENYTLFKRTALSVLLEPDRDETPEDKTFINHVVKIIHYEMGSAKITKSYNYASPKKKKIIRWKEMTHLGLGMSYNQRAKINCTIRWARYPRLPSEKTHLNIQVKKWRGDHVTGTTCSLHRDPHSSTITSYFH